jgi:hypothetical protein
MTRQVRPKVRSTLDHDLPLLRSAAPVLLAMTLMVGTSVLAAGNDAKGTLVYKSRTTSVKYAYLVKGPDVVSKQPIRRLILSATDIGAKIAACKSMSCTDSELGDGLSVNFDGSARFNYWMVQNDQLVQYSGTEPVASLAAKVDDAKRFAGTLRLDKTGAGGPKVDIEFDAMLVKEVSAP